MPADQPFEANLGGTVQVAAVSASSGGTATITSTGLTPSILVTNPSGVTMFVRLDVANITTASSIDIPVLAGIPRIFANPNPVGVTYCTASAPFGADSAVSVIYFTPGEGGIS